MAKAKKEERSLRILALGGSCLSAITLLSLTAALAGGPTGGTVVSGSATISSPAANKTVITQTSNDALINWNSFSISSGSSVTFNQPGRSSLTVNRVTGLNSSQIDGQLTANGQVWILNANGILFGAGSQINVAGLLATTSDISDSNFQSGNYLFQPSSNSRASVVNDGTIDVGTGGSVVLSAPSVTNKGLIHADLGNVVLGGTDTFSVDFTGDNVLRYQVATPSAQAGPTSVTNAGTIAAAGGHVVMTARAAQSVQDSVINNTGVVEATSVSAHDGEIDLDAGPDGTVNVGGTLDASGAGKGQTGGTITATGGAVNVADSAKLNASGNTGGGTILIGGGFHGKGPIANASTTTVGNAAITADATGTGNGGKVAIWSSGQTVFNGAVSAKGGPNGGNGGFVETSGAQLGVGLNAKVDTSAPRGGQGTWLLDPLNIIVQSCGLAGEPACSGSGLTGGTLAVGTDPGVTDVIDPSTITSALGSTNVELQAAQDIFVENDIVYGSANSLFLLAGRNINVFANIQNTKASGGGDIELIAGWDQTTLPPNSLTAPGVFGNNAGAVFVLPQSANATVGSASGQTIVAGADVTVEAGGGFTAQIGFAGPGGGDISVLATGNLVVDGGDNTFGTWAQIGNGGPSVFSGAVGGNINVQAQNISVQSSGQPSQIGNGDPNQSAASGNITVTAAQDLDVQENGTSGLDGGIGNFFAAFAALPSANVYTATPVPGSSSATAISAQTVSHDISYSMELGITNGNFSLTLSGNTALVIDPPSASFSNANTLTLSNGGDITFEEPVQNSGNGAINITSGGTVTIGGPNTLDSVAVGSAGGKTTVSAAALLIESDNANAQLGFSGTGGGDISATATGEVFVSANGGNYAQIGNGGQGLSGAITGNITVQGSDVAVLNSTPCGDCTSWLVSAIGNVGGAGASESGTISVTAADTLTVQATGIQDVAKIGNFSSQPGGNAATGDITVNAGSISLSSNGAAAATIGNGEYAFSAGGFDNSGANGGNISVTADTITMDAEGGSGGFAAIEDVGSGTVTGNINVTTTGDFGITAGDGNSAGIALGGTCAVFCPLGTSSGNLDVQSGGALTLTAQGGASVGISAANDTANSTNTVVANGDITLTASGTNLSGNQPVVVIGDFLGGNATGGGKTSVTSSAGSISLNANETNAFVLIGGGINATGGTFSGSIQVSAPNAANGSISVSAPGSGAFAQIGSFNEGGSITADTTVSAGNTISISAGEPVVVGPFAVPGSGAITTAGNTSFTAPTIGGDFAPTIVNDLAFGNVSLDLTSNQPLFIGTPAEYTSANTLTLSNGGDIDFGQSVQNSGSGAIDITSGGTVTVGGPNAIGPVSVGSAGGTTTVSANALAVSGVNGSAQLGYAGGGSGNIAVTAGSVSLDGGVEPNFFAQIGSGGFQSSNSGNVTVNSTGAVTLTAGSGPQAYAQIGNGGAELDAETHGYTLTGQIAVTAKTLTLDAGGGSASDAQIGNGGFEVGIDLQPGNAVISGNINVTVHGDVILMGGAANDAYAQIGNGGDMVNINAFPGTSSAISGNITVAAAGTVTLQAGAGADSYVQIGDGGYSENSPNTSSIGNFTTGGNINVSDLSLTGGNGGADAYAQIGSGDASKAGFANVDGNITIGFGTESLIDGSAPASPAFIGNATGTGEVSGGVSGGTINSPPVIGGLGSDTQSGGPPPPNLNIPPDVVSQLLGPPPGGTTPAPPPGPLTQLANGTDNPDPNFEPPQPEDELAATLGTSLDPDLGSNKTSYYTSTTIIPGLLKQLTYTGSQSPQGVPGSSSNLSNWGNESFWP